MDNTIVQTGSFISTGTPQTIQLRAGVTFLNVINKTAISNNLANAGYKWEWQVGMSDTGIMYFSGGGAATIDMSDGPAGSFILVDSSLDAPGIQVATTAATNAAQPVISTANTAGLAAGSVVRYYGSTGTPNLNGLEFTIDTVVANTSFRIANALANAPGAVGGTGFYRKIPYNPMFYPARRSIVNITQAAQAVITTSVNSAYVPGQSIRLIVPRKFGMVEANGLLVNIVNVTGGAVTVDLDTRAFTAFTYPLVAAYAFSQAQCVPVGEETDAQSNPNLLDDATINTAYIGVQLLPGQTGPAGQANDQIFWQATRSFNG